MPKIAKLEISTRSGNLSDDPSIDCSDFVLTEKVVRRYFSKMRSVIPVTRYHDLDWSACYGSGTLTFKNGIHWKWTIMRIGVASIYEGKKPVRYFVCEDCEFDPFVSPEPPDPENDSELTPVPNPAGAASSPGG